MAAGFKVSLPAASIATWQLPAPFGSINPFEVTLQVVGVLELNVNGAPALDDAEI